ncbi:hypothetical protein HDU98_007512 [Podochytrium sp. JEL0797]|nr:hypothetical protein HDU98_007512 [Podochytrium sp. JEL0797]
MAAVPSASKTFNFVTMNNPADPTFNQLLGINTAQTIVGYFGSGMGTHPNVGYALSAPNFLASVTNGNVPTATQTQDICINSNNVIGGFWIDSKMTTSGFIRNGLTGSFTSVINPATGTGTQNQILGINDNNIAAGFYTDAMGANHGYTYDAVAATFTPITPPPTMKCNSTTASGINRNGDIIGFCSTTTGSTVSFFMSGGTFTPLTAPGSMNTQALGINNNRQVVGSFVDATGTTHGFIATNPGTAAMFQSIDHPMAVGMGGTVINGLNDAGTLVGFYSDAAGNTNGLMATPGGTGVATVASANGGTTGGVMGGMGMTTTRSGAKGVAVSVCVVLAGIFLF